MPNDLLIKLNIANFRVRDVSTRPVYKVGEVSGIKNSQGNLHYPIHSFQRFLVTLVSKIRNQGFSPTGILLLTWYFVLHFNYFPGDTDDLF